MDFTLYWFMFPVAIMVATCAMLSGIGGAALFTPIFVLVFPLLGPEYVLESTLAAIAAALITQTFGFLSGFIGYYRRGLIDYGLAWRFIRIAVPVSILGVWVASTLPDWVLLAGYSLLVCALAVVLWQRAGSKDDPETALGVSYGKTIVDSRGEQYHYEAPRLGAGNYALTSAGAFLTGLVSVGIGEVTVSQLTHKRIPIAVAAATSVMIVSVTVLFASSSHAVQLIRGGGWNAVPWDLLVWDIPGVLIGGQIGPRLQGLVPQHTMRRAIALLFVILAIAMLGVAATRMS
ncbi:MAG: sulfite exporter TauE/SafE family protein [Woeseiaceae bacterium]